MGGMAATTLILYNRQRWPVEVGVGMVVMVMWVLTASSVSSFSWAVTTTNSAITKTMIAGTEGCRRHHHHHHHLRLAVDASAVRGHCTQRSRRHRSQLHELRLQATTDDDNNEKNPPRLHAENNIFYNDFEDSDMEKLSSRRLRVELEEDSPTWSSSSTPVSSSTTNPPTTRATTYSSSSSSLDTSLFSSLLQRQTQLEQSARKVLHQWISGSANSYAAFTINESYYHDGNGSSLTSPNNANESLAPPFDWVRRVSIGTYPYVACGSAYGSIYVANVESRQVLGAARAMHCPSLPSSQSEDGLLEEDLARCLYGQYDGGGVLAVAMYGTNLVASSGREGGVKIFKLLTSSRELKLIGEVLATPNNRILVTCLKFDSLGRLYMGGEDGHLRMVDLSSGNDVDKEDVNAMQVKLISCLEQKQQQSVPTPTSSSILSLGISEELEMVATAHDNGDICIYSLNNDNQLCDDANFHLGRWNPFRETTHARSVAFISSHGESRDEKEERNDSNNDDVLWSVVAGGGNGELWLGDIEPSYCSNDATTVRQVSAPVIKPVINLNSIQQIKPNHQGPVLSLATRPGGILVSAGHDGMLRVTRIRPTPTALYGLGGYKVWLGNICIDSEGRRLLSDGRDDVVVVHDFSNVLEDE